MRITNDVLAEYLAADKAVKKLNRRLKEIRESVRRAKGAETKEFVAKLKPMDRRCLAAYEKFVKKMGPGWLEKNKLVETRHYDQVVVLKRKKGK